MTDLALLAALVGGTLLRLVRLSSDPVHPTWLGWVIDEGRWTQLAREWALFGTVGADTGVSRMHLLLAPLHQLYTAVSFEALGVGFTSARLPSSVAGIAVLLLVAVVLRRELLPGAALVSGLLVAFDPDLVYFSRVAIPEMGALFLQATAFFALVLGPRTSRRAALGGVLAAAAVATKATIAPALIAFVPMPWLACRSTDPDGPRVRAVAFLLGAAVPGLVLLAAIAVLAGSGIGPEIGMSVIPDLAGFVSVVPPIEMLTSFYQGGRGTGAPAADASNVNLLLAVVWLLVVANGFRGMVDSESRVLFVGALLWAAGWILPKTTLTYFPHRWVVHLHLPLAIAVGAGVSLLGAPGRRSFAEALHRLSPMRGRLVAALAAVPVALVLAPWLVSVFSAAGADLDRMRYHVPLTAVLAAAGGLLVRRGGREPLGPWSLAFPLGALLIWRAYRGPDTVGGYWTADGLRAAFEWTAILGVAALLCAVATLAARSADPVARVRRSIYAYGVGLAGVWIFADLPRRPAPTWVAPAIAGAIDERYGDDVGVIGVDMAATVMLGSRHPYHEIVGSDALPDVVVAAVWRNWGQLPPDPDQVPRHSVAAEFVVPRYGTRIPAVVVRLYERGESAPDGR